MKNTGKIQKAYDFFCKMEKEGNSFTQNDIQLTTGWSKSTADGDRTKKWHQFIVEDEDEKLSCRGLLSLPFESFIKLYEQRAEISPEDYRPHYGFVIDTYIEKSREAALLAIQIYNNPSVKFRTEGFIVYMMISFTALFHAYFEKIGIDYWYVNKETGLPEMINGDKRYWELSTCVNEFYMDTQTPEKENLKLCIEIRNKIEHRFYNSIDLNLSGYCQSLLLNYEMLLISEFGEYFSLGGSQLSLALQLSSYNNKQQKVLNVIQTKYFNEIQDHITNFCKDIPFEIKENGRFNFRAFFIPKIGNHASSSDISIEWVKYDPNNPEEMDKYQKTVGFIKEKTTQVANQGMYLPGDVVRLIKERGFTFDMGLHTRARKLFMVRPKGKSPNGCNTKYCQFSEPHKNYVYTNEWVEFLVSKIQNPDELEKIRNFREK